MSKAIVARLRVIQGDITGLDVDAIVNAANEPLLGGGGVDGAIHRAAGPGLLDECRGLGGCPVGQARLTRGHRLKARHVIHTVGPVYHGGARGEPALLASCYRESLRLCAEAGLASIAFPCISTGAYGYPKDEACAIAVDTVAEWLAGHEEPRIVKFCCFSGDDVARYGRRIAALLTDEDEGDDDHFASIRWRAPEENPFGVEVLDCRHFAQSMVATTGDERLAGLFLDLRGSDGAQHRGREPEGPVMIACDLRYPPAGEVGDGPLFRAEAMEDKWDIYHHEGRLYFARSWSGVLEYTAEVAFGDAATVVSAVTARRPAVGDEPGFAVAVVDFLIRSHLLGMMVPHPLPESEGRDPRKLALWSFSLFGCRGLAGMLGDTTQVQPLPRGPR